MCILPKVKPLHPPEERPRFENMPYARVTPDSGQACTLKLDIYQPPERNTPGPCIIYIFGGGFLWGEYKQVTQKTVYCRDLVRLTEEGYTVACPDCRLASQSILPVYVHNVKGAVRFLRASGEKYSIDPDRIDALGNSAGGCPASMLALSASCRELEGEVGGNLEHGSSIKAAAIFYASADLCQSIRTSAATLSGSPRDLIGMEIEGVGNDSAGVIPALIVGYTGLGRSLFTLNQVLERNDPRDPDWRFIELIRECNPVTYAGAGRLPVAIFQGGRGTVVDPDQSGTPYHASIRAGADTTFVTCFGSGHGPSLGEGTGQFAYNLLKKRLW